MHPAARFMPFFLSTSAARFSRFPDASAARFMPFFLSTSAARFMRRPGRLRACRAAAPPGRRGARRAGRAAAAYPMDTTR